MTADGGPAARSRPAPPHRPPLCARDLGPPAAVRAHRRHQQRRTRNRKTCVQCLAVHRETTRERPANQLTLSSVSSLFRPRPVPVPRSVPRPGAQTCVAAGDSSSRREKSLGILCLRFVVLFLTSENNAISLADAATALLHDGDDDEENGGADDDAATDAGDSKSSGLAASVRSARYKSKCR